MSRIDPWHKAAECERALQKEGDSTRREILTNLRNLWIALANERSLLTGSELDQQVAAIDRIQNDLSGPAPATLH